MATIQIADNDARVQYTQAVTANVTQLTIDFPFFDLDDINVIVTSAAGVDTTLSRGTGTGTFAVTGTAVDDGYSGGYITLGDTYSDSATTYTIFRDIPVARTTDFPTSGPFNIASLNTALDKIIAIEQELETKITRTLQLADTDATVTLKLPNLNTRKGKTLAFNTTTGVPEAGPSITDIGTIQSISTDIATLADIEDGTDATDAIQTVAGISANVTTVAGISSNVTTVAGVTTDLANVTANLTDIQNASTNATNAAASATAAATSETNAATSETNAASSASSASTSATSAASSATSASTSATNAATSETNAASSATSASTSASTATTKASEASTSASNAATSETNAATSATNAATSATSASSSASSAASSATAAASSAAAAAATFDNFDDTYLGAFASNPTVDNDGDPLNAGDLHFNTTANEMRVYDGSQWIAASAAQQVSFVLFEYTATASQTTFSGADDNAATLSYTAGNIQVMLNGVVLDPSDFTATNGTSVVLASGAALNDVLNIYAFTSFTVADTVPASTGGTFSGNINVVGSVTSDGLTVDGASVFNQAASDQSGGAAVKANGTAYGTNKSIHAYMNTSNASKSLIYAENGAGSVFNVDGAGDISFYDSTGVTQGFFWDASAQRLGLGVTNPNANIQINSANGSACTLNMSQTAVTNYKWEIPASTDAFTLVYGASTERLRIDSSGGLRVNTTSNIANGASNEKLTVDGSTAGQAASFSTSASGGFPALYVRNTLSGTINAIIFLQGSPAAQVGSITMSGGTSTAYNTSSDYRLKENVTADWDATTRLKQLNPVRFNFIADPDTTVDGFLAHEVQDIVPEAITGTKDAMRDEQYEVTPAVFDEDGNEVTPAVMGTRSVPDYQGIDQSKLVPLLVKTIQELEARITALENA